MAVVSTLEALDALYGAPGETSMVKVVDHVSDHYAAFIAASPFVALATSGPEGLDCSPRGDRPGFVRVADRRTLIMPDRRGNNRADSLRNIIRDPRCAFLFLIPGSGTCLRANGRAAVVDDADLLESFAVDGQAPRTAIVLTTEAVYFQCARAIVRSGLWDPATHVDSASLPTPGDILRELSAGRVGGRAYDEAWPERAKASLW